MKSIRRISVSEQVLSSILSYIQEHHLKVGDKLPTEAFFSETFRVSRTSVREAMKALSINGALESIPGRGTFIRPPMLDIILNETDNTVIQARVTISQLMEVRTALEQLAIELAIERGTDEEIRALEDDVARLNAAILSDSPWAALDTEFHVGIAEMARNPLLLKSIRSLSATIVKYRDAMTAANTDMSGYVLEHGRMLDALRARDKKAAVRAVKQHMEITEELLKELVDKNSAGLFVNVD